jgi:hypothetical protein
MRDLINQGIWAVPGLLLLIVAWVGFNRPPTNRSGTTFLLFHLGVAFYYALLIAIWLFVIVLLQSGSSGIEYVSRLVGDGGNARDQIGAFAPVVAALILVVAIQVSRSRGTDRLQNTETLKGFSQFEGFDKIRHFDEGARQFCMDLAHIPTQANQLARELATAADFQLPSEELRKDVALEITHNIGRAAVHFKQDGSLESRLTKAISLYHSFLLPGMKGLAPEFARSHYKRSAYVRIMDVSARQVGHAASSYEALLESAVQHYRSKNPTRDSQKSLEGKIADFESLTCGLVARYVLYQEKTASQRMRRLERLGFTLDDPGASLGGDKWVASVLATTFLTFIVMICTPQLRPMPIGQAAIVALTFALQVGLGVIGGAIVARRFLRWSEGRGGFPPIAQLTGAGLVVVGISAGLRIGMPLLPAVLQPLSFSSALQSSLSVFAQRWPGLIYPFICTFSIGLLCSHLGTAPWSRVRLGLIGAIGNGLAFMAAGVLVSALLDESVLATFYWEPAKAPLVVIATSGVIGAAIGAMILASFRSSLPVEVSSPAEASVASMKSPVGFTPPSTLIGASQELGGYLRKNVADIEGRYVCFRPTFNNPEVFSAYLAVIRWDEEQSCLVFEEQARADAIHTQKGRVYIPLSKPFFSLITIDDGAVRLIMVSRPHVEGLARGLIMTLSNPAGVQFTPASAPVVLRRLGEEVPQLGFIHAGAPDYDRYKKELESVVPAFGILTPAVRPQPVANSASPTLP